MRLRGTLGIRLRSLVGALALALPCAVQAVLIDLGDGTGNTTAPPDDFGFENVGKTSPNNLSGVYLGDGWVLTANHVGDKPITLLGNTYAVEPGSRERLTNPHIPELPDLIVYRILGAPTYPVIAPVKLSSFTPTVGEQLHCVGHGTGREATVTDWDIDWQEQPPTVYSGYVRQGPGVKRWGTNLVTLADIDVLDTRSIDALFDDTAGLTDESQAVPGDSGGGCFAKRGGTWELVGLMFARSLWDPPPPPGCDPGDPCDPPPQPSNFIVYGNGTFSADVAFYRDQIEELTAPEIPALPPLAAAALGALLAAGARPRLARRR